MIKGVVSRDLVTKINDKVCNLQRTQLYVSLLYDFIYHNIMEKIWKPRCEAMIVKEKEAGISQRAKLSRCLVESSHVDRNFSYIDYNLVSTVWQPSQLLNSYVLSG